MKESKVVPSSQTFCAEGFSERSIKEFGSSNYSCIHIDPIAHCEELPPMNGRKKNSHSPLAKPKKF
jgi:hypothetical protein